MTSAHRPIFSLNPASWPISIQAVAVVLAVSLAPMLFTAYYNSSSREALRDIDLRSQRQIAGNVVAGQIGASVNMYAITGVQAVIAPDVAPPPDVAPLVVT